MAVVRVALRLLGEASVPPIPGILGSGPEGPRTIATRDLEEAGTGEAARHPGGYPGAQGRPRRRALVTMTPEGADPFLHRWETEQSLRTGDHGFPHLHCDVVLAVERPH